MLYYDKIDISKEIDLAKINNSKETIICQYWLFNHGFKFQDSVCNVCHVLTMLSVNKSVIAIITIRNVDYCCIIHTMSKSEALNLLKCSVLFSNLNRFKVLFLTFFVLVNWLIISTSVSL